MWRNSDFWIKANQLHERLQQKYEFYKQNLDAYAANAETAEVQGPDSQAAQALAEARKNIMTAYHDVYGVNIYLADLMLAKK